MIPENASKAPNPSSNPSGPGHFPGGVPAGLTVETLWTALAGDPQIGVSIVGMDGKILFTNETAARLFNGDKATAREVIGKSLQDLYAPEWVRERLAVMRRVLLTGKPVLLRTIWRGYQIMSWVNYIDGEPADEGDDPGAQGRAAPPQFLVITRRVSGEQPEAGGETRYEFVESSVAELGPLDVLTPRELEVLSLIGHGLSLKEIADVLFRSVKTVDKHRTAIGEKLSAHDRVQLAELAQRAGLTVRDAGKTRV